MGALTDAMVAYARPFLEGSEGSPREMEKALMLGQICWNLSLMPEEGFAACLAELQQTLHMSTDEFAAFRRSVLEPMIQRHREMFPEMHQRRARRPPLVPASPPEEVKRVARPAKYPGTGRNDPCPCNSGLKYKRCCGR